VTAEGFAPTTISRDVSVLHAMFKSAVRVELVEVNPAASAERPKQESRRWRILEAAEVARVAKAFVDDQDRAVFLVLVLTGVRRSELQALRWRDVDLLERVLRIRKAKSEAGERSIALAPVLRDVLTDRYKQTRFRGNDELVFCHLERGTYIERSGSARLLGRRWRPPVSRPPGLCSRRRRSGSRIGFSSADLLPILLPT
jgi:integrase